MGREALLASDVIILSSMLNQLPAADSLVFTFHDLILWTDDLTNKTYCNEMMQVSGCSVQQGKHYFS